MWVSSGCTLPSCMSFSRVFREEAAFRGSDSAVNVVSLPAHHFLPVKMAKCHLWQSLSTYCPLVFFPWVSRQGSMCIVPLLVLVLSDRRCLGMAEYSIPDLLEICWMIKTFAVLQESIERGSLGQRQWEKRRRLTVYQTKEQRGPSIHTPSFSIWANPHTS